LAPEITHHPAGRATLGNGDAALFGSGRPDLLEAVTGYQVADGANNVRLNELLGTKTVQRISIAQDGPAVVIGMWPGELLEQARRFYSDGRATAMVSAGSAAGWEVTVNLHLGFWNAASALRLYLNPLVPASEFVTRMEGEDHAQIRQVQRDELVSHVWPWLIARHYASDADDAAFRRFLEVLGSRPVHVRPGLRFLMTLEAAQRPDPDSVRALSAVIQAAVNEVLAAAGEPLLG
jgi:hypothetical protein